MLLLVITVCYLYYNCYILYHRHIWFCRLHSGHFSISASNRILLQTFMLKFESQWWLYLWDISLVSCLCVIRPRCDKIVQNISLFSIIDIRIILIHFVYSYWWFWLRSSSEQLSIDHLISQSNHVNYVVFRKFINIAVIRTALLYLFIKFLFRRCLVANYYLPGIHIRVRFQAAGAFQSSSSNVNCSQAEKKI